jgi:hypothetical protein
MNHSAALAGVAALTLGMLACSNGGSHETARHKCLREATAQDLAPDVCEGLSLPIGDWKGWTRLSPSSTTTLFHHSHSDCWAYPDPSGTTIAVCTDGTVATF